MIELDQLHPDAQFLVMTNVARSESGFLSGRGLQANWDGAELAKVGPSTTVPGDWILVIGPDARCVLIKFLSTTCRLVAAGTKPEPAKKPNTMTDKKPVKKVPPKKGETPPAAAPQTPGEATTSGIYPWLRNRMKAAIVDKAKDDQKKELRASMKDADAKQAIKLAQKAGVIGEDPADVVKFLVGVVEDGVTKAK